MKNKLSKYYLFVSIITLISIMVVIAQKSYSNIMGPITSAKSSNLLKPVDPNLNVDIINDLQTKKEFQPDDINPQVWHIYNKFQITPTVIPEPTP